MNNFREMILPSVFFHLVLFLLIVAVSRHPADFSRAFRNVVLIDLAAENNKSAVIGSSHEPRPASSPRSDNQMDQVEDISHDESKEIPEAENKTESVKDSMKMENKENRPAGSDGFVSPEAYYDFIVLHKKIFRQESLTRVNDLIGEALNRNTREFFGGTAVVSLKYGPDRKLSGILVDATTPELKAFLEEIGWDAIPAPAAYSLGYTVVQIEFKVLEGLLSFNVDAL